MLKRLLILLSRKVPDSRFLNFVGPCCSIVSASIGGAANAMRNKRALALPLILTCLLTLPAWPQSDATARQDPLVHKPVVRKIEPPNWWVNYTPKLTLLITGEKLSGARVESPTRGLTVLGAEASANGHYLFVHLQLSSHLPVGIVPLRLNTSAGSTTVPLPLLDRADSHGRF